MIQDVHDPRIIPVLLQYVEIRQRVETVVLEPATEDCLVWRWSSSGTYSSSLTYTALFYGQTSILRGGAMEVQGFG
jgi:hypothetical protein